METEFSSALSIKVRSGALTIEQRAAAARIFDAVAAASLKMLPIEAKHLEVAARFAGNPATKLRRGCLHLAIASENDATLTLVA